MGYGTKTNDFPDEVSSAGMSVWMIYSLPGNAVNLQSILQPTMDFRLLSKGVLMMHLGTLWLPADKGRLSLAPF